MNLVQIQDRLKGMPMQAVMAYANGQNPEVPPYLALGELNRRKQMEQQAAQPPKASVKDEVEQSLMARNAMQQGIMGTPRAMQTTGETAEMPAAPQPGGEEEYATGGVVALPVRNEMFDYAGGGIVAFAGGDVVQGNTGDEYYAEPLSDEELSKIDRLRALKKFAEFAGRNTEVDPDTGEVTRKVAPKEVPAPVVPVAAPQQTAPSTAAGAQLPPQAPPVVRPAPQQIPTGGIASNPAGNAAAQFLAKSFQQAPAAIPAYEPPKQAPLGQKWEEYLGKLEKQDTEADQKFKETEQQRAKSALWKSLIAAGEATRGGGGIGALLGGYGKSALSEEEAALGRQAEQAKLVRERQMNNAKMQAELENLRRAEERGDSKAIYDSKIKIHELERQDQDLKQRAAERIYAETEANKRTNLTHAGSPSETRFINDWLNNHPGKTYSDAYAAYKLAGAGTATERQDLAELRALQKAYTDQADPTKNFDKASREDAVRRLATVNKRLEEMAGMGEPAKVMSMADVAATAKSSGKTEQQVIEAAKARGYTIK